MAKVLVLYYSSYGHIETMANAVVEGAREADVEVTLKRVPETAPEEVVRKANFKTDQPAPIATPNELVDYDAIIFGSGTRFGNVTSQLRSFMDQTGGLWGKGALIGKVGSVFTSSATNAGSETTITSFWNTLAHHGMVIVGLPYNTPDLTDISEVRSGTPYGAATIAGPDGSRQPSEIELRLARHQGRHVADIARRLHGLAR